MSLYFCEGVPIGLQAIALPAWLLANGRSTEEVGAFRAMATLPWSLKIFVAPLMDTCTCRTFGFRRPWVCMAQFGLIAALFTMGLVSSQGVVLQYVTLCAFLVNTCSATMDVAIDGMAIDILEEKERGIANALMGAGQTLGFATLGAICGVLLPVVGLTPAAFLCACFMLPPFLLIACSLERPGERRLPHSDCMMTETGVTGAEGAPPPAEASLGDKACSVVRGLALDRASRLVLLSYFAATVSVGVGEVMWPKVGLAHEVSSSYYATLTSMTSFAAAALSLGAGYGIDRFGAPLIFFVSMGFGGLPLIAVSLLEEHGRLTRTVYSASTREGTRAGP